MSLGAWGFKMFWKTNGWMSFLYIWSSVNLFYFAVKILWIGAGFVNAGEL